MVAREVTKCLLGYLPDNHSCAPLPARCYATGLFNPLTETLLYRYQGVPNFLYQFTLNSGEQWDITFTAVRGHLMGLEFPPQCKSWKSYPTKQLFDVDVHKAVGSVRSPPCL